MILIAASILTCFTLATNAEEPKYTNYSFARLSYMSGNIYIQRASDLGYEEGTVNMPISEGDRLGTTDGRAEVYLGRNTYIRLDEKTKLDFMNFPKKGYELTRLKVWTGNIYLNVNNLEKEKSIELHTPDASIYILDEGIYRIDVREDNETEILVFRGLVEAAGEEGSLLIKNEQRLAVSNGHFNSRPTSFFAAIEDGFDRWNESRNDKITKRLAKTYLTGELEDFEYELAEYGEWIYISPFGYVWVPQGMAPDWHPYYYGRWAWFPLCGWSWVPYEPWGWCTFHYGRWHWSPIFGWYWIPMNIWGPAWVSWWWGYDYFAWTPLSYWGYPVVIVNNVFYGQTYYDVYPYNSKTLTVIHKNQLQAKNISKVALDEKSIRNLGKIDFRGEPQKSLDFKPVKDPNVSIEPLEGRKVILRKETRPTKFEPFRSLEKRQTKEKDSSGAQRTAKSGIEKTKRDETVRQSPPPSSPPPPTERKIKKKKDSDSSPEDVASESHSRRGNFGFPSSSSISRESSSRESQSTRPKSFLNRFFRYFSEGSSSRSSSSSQKASPSRGFSLHSSPRSSPPPSMSRGSSSSGSSSRPAGVNKKKG